MLNTYTKNAEKRFLDMVAKLRDSTAGYYVVHFKFSQLQEHYKNEYQLKISVNIISDILRSGEGAVFVTHDNDIFVFCRQVMLNTIRKMVFQLRYLYMDDPLAYKSENVENPEFSDLYDLKASWQQMFEFAKAKMEALEKEIEADNYSLVAAQFQNADSRVLTPAKLYDVEIELGKTSIIKAFRSQPICAAKSDGFQEMFNEAYINIASLSSQLRTNVDLASNRWLFKYLTQILDRKMLEFISKNSRKYMKNPLSLNLNTETLLSETFADFDRSIDAQMKKSIVIEIQISDVFADMNAFVAARNLIHEKGYRICVDGLNYPSFLQVDRNSLGFDLAKLLWNMDLQTDVKRKHNKEISEAIQRCGPSRVILSRCDSVEAIYYGQSLGIGLFQGRYVDSILNPDSDIVN